jgi:hypothetical protein
LSSDDYTTIFNIGKDLFDIITFSRYPSGGPSPWAEDGLDPMPVVADVHTEANSGQVLEEGVGYPYAIYVICSIEGQPVIAKGAGFSYYEFHWPMTDRLTDEKWREMLKSDNPPSVIDWANSFISGADHKNQNPQCFQWRKPNSLVMNTAIKPENPRVGDIVTVTIEVNDWFGEYGSTNPPDVWVTTPDGTTYKIDDITSGTNPNSTWDAHIATSSMSTGTVYVAISKIFAATVLNFRTRFNLESAQSVMPEVNRPHGFALYQNQPNPFNPTTVIHFELPTICDVSLDVYNISGHHVCQLLSGSLNTGSYQIVWNGRNNLNQVMGSGIYFYKLKAGDFVAIKRMILVK